MIGVAGVGMSALAQALLAAGHRVTGSDRYLDQGGHLEVLDKLRRAGVRLMPQDGLGVTDETDAVVVSTAIEPDNPDWAAARARAIPVFHRAEMLARLASGSRLVAVTGTSGKTTVTGLLGWMLEQAGRDPTVVNGGVVLNWKTAEAVGNFRRGASDLWLVEADESDRSLLHFQPEWAVITNLSRDHFDLPETGALFRTFLCRVRRGVVCGRGVAGALYPPGEKKPPLFFIELSFDYEERGRQVGFRYEGMFFPSPLPGVHNAENAWLAVVIGQQLGVEPAVMREALASFKGIERRLEQVGEAGGVRVVDDYAHNPAKIRAAWQALARTHARVHGIWRPHGFGPLAAMMDELQAAFLAVCRPGDRLYLLPVYYAGGTAPRAASSQDLADRLQRCGLHVAVWPRPEAVRQAILSEARPGDVVLLMGARDPELPHLARQIVEDLKGRSLLNPPAPDAHGAGPG